MKTLKQLGEFNFINAVAKDCIKGKHVLKGIGDDAAVVKVSKNSTLLFTSDMLIENVHFKRSQSPYAIGHKAIACSISDTAAMSALPVYALVSLAFPENISVDFAKKIYQGIKKTAKEFNISIIGGDTNKADRIIIDVFMCAKAVKNKFILRSTAKNKDLIYVTGSLGGSGKQKHLNFIPRVKESLFLSKHYPISSMIDVSDGLIGDLNHIIKQSKKGAILFTDKVPLSKQAAFVSDAFYTGEDYELLFTIAKRHAKSLEKNWPFKKLKLTCIGEITNKRSIFAADKNGNLKKVEDLGFKHF